MRNNKIILYDEEYKYYIYDMSGNLILKTNKLTQLKQGYLIKNSNNKLVLLDEDINQISDEYDIMALIF